MGDGQRLEPRWRCIKEGEVSPYKVVLCLFIRENFLVSPLLQVFSLEGMFPGEEGELEEKQVLEKSVSPRTLLLIYKLITANDMPFTKLKALIEDPVAQVRPEVLRKFMKIIGNLEDGSVSFLYELFHSVIDFKSSQVVVLRKKVEKNSPFGKFLRMVLMNVRRMSYPQIHYLYKQVCGYVGEFVKSRKKSIGVIPPGDVAQLGSRSGPVTPVGKEGGGPGQFIFRERDKDDPSPLQIAAVTVLQDVWPGGVGTSKPFKSQNKISQQQPNPSKFRGLEIFQRMTDRGRKGGGVQGMDLFSQYTTEYKRATGKWSLAQERDLQRANEDKRRKVLIAKEARKSLRNLWQPNPLLRTASQASLDNTGDQDTSGGRPMPKRRSGGRHGAGGGGGSIQTYNQLRQLPPRSPRKNRQQQQQHLQQEPQEELIMLRDGDDGYLPSDEDTGEILMGPPLTPTMPSTPKSPRGKNKSASKVKTTPNSGSGSGSGSGGSSFGSTLAGTGDSGDFSSEGDPSLSPTHTIIESRSFLERMQREVPASKKWEQIKWWSRKQIERALKQLSSELLNTSEFAYSPRDISAFVELVIQNPSAQILLSQIFFIEYLNCLRLKDIRRCSESLRTSFDIRIKPNTSELNKGVPYAPYNFAVFYNFLGYKKDAILCLEEAFRAGHSATDATCLHYCHNLWSLLQNKPYTDAIVTVTKEVDNNMAYLHSLNVIANAFDYHYQRQPPEEVLYTLWHYNAECDLEEMESLLLLSLSGFFMAFGWHEMVSFPCQIILNSKLKWPLKAYCKALIILSDSLLLRGETDVPLKLMEYGETLFGHDASPVGELFYLRHASFKAYYASLSYRPVEPEVLATLYSYSKVEGCYWLAYTKMVENEWEEASNLLNILSSLLLDEETSCENNDMKIRCLLLMAELQCLSGAPAAALGFIYEALDIAYSFCADHFITLCLSHIASIQCEMGLPAVASKTLHKEMRCAIRSSNPWLNARLNVVIVRIGIGLRQEESQIGGSVEALSRLVESQLMDKLNFSQELYIKLGNNYRLKEVYNLKAELLDKTRDKDGGHYRRLAEELGTHLIWSPETCLM